MDKSDQWAKDLLTTINIVLDPKIMMQKELMFLIKPQYLVWGIKVSQPMRSSLTTTPLNLLQPTITPSQILSRSMELSSDHLKDKILLKLRRHQPPITIWAHQQLILLPKATLDARLANSSERQTLPSLKRHQALHSTIKVDLLMTIIIKRRDIHAGKELQT